MTSDPIPSEKTQAKAAELLLTGKVKVQQLTISPDVEETYFLAFVQTSEGGDPYHVKFDVRWTCDCPARVVCSHLLACQTIAPEFENLQTVEPVNPETEAMDIDALLEGI